MKIILEKNFCLKIILFLCAYSIKYSLEISVVSFLSSNFNNDTKIISTKPNLKKLLSVLHPNEYASYRSSIQYSPDMKIHESQGNIKISKEENNDEEADELYKKFKIPLVIMMNDATETSPPRVKPSLENYETNKLARSQDLGEELDNEKMYNKNNEDPAIDWDGYIGCFIDGDTPSRDLSIRVNIHNIIPYKCRIECGKIKLRYSALQYGYLCFCGKKYGKYGDASEVVCKTPCSGNSSIACGGYWKNALYHSIYLEDLNKDIEPMRIIPNTTRNYQILTTPIQKHEIKTTTQITKPTNSTETYEVVRSVVNNVNNHSEMMIGQTAFIPDGKSINDTTSTPSIVNTINFVITPIPIVEPGAILYSCYILLKQPWASDFNKKESTKYKILRGNFMKAMNNESYDITGILKYQLNKFKQENLKIQGNTNRVPRVGVYFSILGDENYMENHRQLIDLIQARLEENKRFGGMPTYPSTFSCRVIKGNGLKDQKTRDAFSTNKIFDRTRRENDYNTETKPMNNNKTQPLSLREILNTLKRYAYKDGD